MRHSKLEQNAKVTGITLRAIKYCFNTRRGCKEIPNKQFSFVDEFKNNCL